MNHVLEWLSKEVRDLWQLFLKTKAGEAAGNAPPAQAAEEKAANGASSNANDEDEIEADGQSGIDLSMIESQMEVVEEDPVKVAAVQEAHKITDRIKVHRVQAEGLEQAAKAYVSGSKLGIIVDCQTSRVKVNVDYLEAIKAHLQKNNITRYSIAIIVGSRPGRCNTIKLGT